MVRILAMTTISKAHILFLGIYHKAIITATGKDSIIMAYARRSNQSILKEISPVCSLVGLMLKLELQYFGHLMRRADSLEKTLMLGKLEGGRRRG